jgi:hypothetical protein
MAKILLVSKSISPTAWELALALRAQQHQVVFLTSYGETVDNNKDIEILSFFRSWNAFETAQLIPALMGMNPQIVHFILEKDSVTSAHMMLWAFTQAKPSVVFTISLLHVRRGLHKRNWVRYLIQNADIVTCPSVDTLAQLRGIDVRSARQGRGLLPPVLAMPTDTAPLEEKLEIEELLSGQKYLVRPFSEPGFDTEAPYFKGLLQFLRKYKVVLLGSQDQWSLRERKRFQKWLADEGLGDRWFLTGHRSLDQVSSLLKGAEALWLANLELTPMELTSFFMKSLETSTTLILDPRQARLHAPLWVNGVNCWILGEVTDEARGESALPELVQKISLKLDYNFESLQITSKDLVDAPLNELNRLYIKALSQKANV